jgi:5-methylcytosine-specific restriction protein A
MPYKPARPCRFIGCAKTTTAKTGYCESHARLWRPYERPRGRDARPGSAKRGYNGEWQRIRAETLAAFGLPKQDWHLYDVHHDPAYNPAVEPDHRKYRLTPLLRADHSRETNRQRRDRGRGE